MSLVKSSSLALSVTQATFSISLVTITHRRHRSRLSRVCRHHVMAGHTGPTNDKGEFEGLGVFADYGGE